MPYYEQYVMWRLCVSRQWTFRVANMHFCKCVRVYAICNQERHAFVGAGMPLPHFQLLILKSCSNRILGEFSIVLLYQKSRHCHVVTFYCSSVNHCETAKSTTLGRNTCNNASELHFAHIQCSYSVFLILLYQRYSIWMVCNCACDGCINDFVTDGMLLTNRHIFLTQLIRSYLCQF